ncbi:ATP-dependent protease La [Dirofilaria immitis]|nr:ATP-dependent protease La [Dirofilaria immitis]
MDKCDESDDTQSDNDEKIDDMITVSHSDKLTVQEISRDQIFSTITAFSTPEPNYSSANYPVQYLNYNNVNSGDFSTNERIKYQSGFYTNTQPPAFIADDHNVANYEEVSTYPYLHNPPFQSISLLPEIHRPALSYQPSLITSLSTYSVNEHVPHPFMAPTLPPLSTDVTNNLPEPVVSSQQTITMMQTASQSNNNSCYFYDSFPDSCRKRLSDNATGMRKANIMSEGNETFPSDISGQLVPKRRGRKRKGNDDDTGKANVALQKQQRSKKCRGEKRRKDEKKRSHKKSETIDSIINDMKDHGLATGRLSAAKKKCVEEELLYKQKNRMSMAFPKGSFLIRYSDLETLDCDQVWCVDNHHMLLKYRLSTHIEGKRRLYLKSQPERLMMINFILVRWLEVRGAVAFYQLTVIERDRDGSKVLILYPDAKELAESREKAKRQKQIAEEMKRGVGNSHDADDNKLLYQTDFDEIKGIEKSSNFMDPEHQQENVEVQMTKEAANAIERFILISEDDYTETNKKHVAESVFLENPVDVIPSENEKDMQEIPAKIKEKVNIVLVKNIDKVIKVALIRPTIQIEGNTGNNTPSSFVENRGGSFPELLINFGMLRVFETADELKEAELLTSDSVFLLPIHYSIRHERLGIYPEAKCTVLGYPEKRLSYGW